MKGAFFRVRDDRDIQGSAKRRGTGLVNFVPAVAYHFCLALPTEFTQPWARLLADPCTVRSDRMGTFHKQEMEEGFILFPRWR